MPLNKQYIIGVDGGGTKTRAVIGTKCGEVLAVVEGAGANIKSTPPTEVQQQITKLLTELLQKVGVTRKEVSTIFLCMAGGDRQVDFVRWHNWMDLFFLSESCEVHVTNDAVAALTSGTFAHEGLVIIAGTGSIVYCVQKNNYVSRVGGWGYLFGDEGSGYYIGQEALRAITQHYDAFGRDDDALTEAILEQLGLKDPTEMITVIYEHAQARALIASIVQTVLQLAEQGHETAKDIIERATTYLAQLLLTMFQKEPQVKCFPIVTCGGLFNSSYFFNCFQRKLQQVTIDNRLIQPEVPPVIGAFIKGLISEGVHITESLQQTVKESWMSKNKM